MLLACDDNRAVIVAVDFISLVVLVHDVSSIISLVL